MGTQPGLTLTAAKSSGCRARFETDSPKLGRTAVKLTRSETSRQRVTVTAPSSASGVVLCQSGRQVVNQSSAGGPAGAKESAFLAKKKKKEGRSFPPPLSAIWRREGQAWKDTEAARHLGNSGRSSDSARLALGRVILARPSEFCNIRIAASKKTHTP